jgi:hypothetical protein
VTNALERAERDREWIVLPADRMPEDPNSLDARLQMNASLFADECGSVGSGQAAGSLFRIHFATATLNSGDL